MLPMVIDTQHLPHFTQMLKEKQNPDFDVVNHRAFSVADAYGVPIAQGFQGLVAMLGNGTAVIPIIGPIDFKPSMLSQMGFMTSSQAVREDFAELVADPSVSRVVFDIDSPGGLYSGLPELARDVFASRGQTETVAVANPLAASGALWLGASAERFFVLGSGQVGSMGALMVHQDFSRMLDESGVTTTIIRDPEGKADFNPFEPLSEESLTHHQQMINQIAWEFTTAMARFRGLAKSTAAERFGKGRILDASAAVEAGLVDGIVNSLSAVIGSKRIKSTRKVRLHPRLALARAALRLTDSTGI